MREIEALFSDKQIGTYCHDLAYKLFPLCRSITGQGVRDTLTTLQEQNSGLHIREVPRACP